MDTCERDWKENKKSHPIQMIALEYKCNELNTGGNNRRKIKTHSIRGINK